MHFITLNIACARALYKGRYTAADHGEQRRLRMAPDVQVCRAPETPSLAHGMKIPIAGKCVAMRVCACYIVVENVFQVSRFSSKKGTGEFFMPLVSVSTLLKRAQEKKYGVASFNIFTLETAVAGIQAAKALNAGVILQVYSRLFEDKVMGMPLAVAACYMAQQEDVPVAVTVDHGANREVTMMAARAGCSGVMIDASTEVLEENIRKTADVCKLMHAVGVSVEGELGHVGMAKDGIDGTYTDPDEAVEYAEKTGVDALAVMVGTAHGRYKQLPVLDIARVETIAQRTGVPLVLHGGSGVPDEQIQAAVKAGVCKLNIGTNVCATYQSVVKSRSLDDPIWERPLDIFAREPIARTVEFMKECIVMLGSENSAR